MITSGRTLFLLLFLAHSSLAEIPCFPGAEGYGTTTRGGRGGDLLFVTNTNASGPGSLRAAVEASGPRIVVFRVGGVIELNGTLMVRNPFITIAGQTAPGDGIVIKNGMIAVKTHDVVIRGLRIRQSDDRSGTKADIKDAIEVWGHRQSPGEVYNVVIDHNSLSWGVDVNLDIGGTAHDVTVSWNIISEGLKRSIHSKGDHSKAMAFHKTAGTNLTAHHNLLAHNDQRNPRIVNPGRSEFINNVVYDFGKVGTDIGGDLQTAIVGNYYKSGPSTGKPRGPITPIEIYQKARSDSGLEIFLDGNMFNGVPYADNWDLMNGDRRFKADSMPFTGSGLTVSCAEEAYELVLEYAGAVSPKRDPVDLRVVKNTREGTGRIIDSPDDVGGWPSVSKGTPPQDSDDDGMPDAWELEQGLDPKRFDANEDHNGNGYTNIEEYINSLLPSPLAGRGEKEETDQTGETDQ